MKAIMISIKPQFVEKILNGEKTIEIRKTIPKCELPKSCDNCEFGYFYDCQYCTLRPDLMIKDEWCEKEKHCKLLSLSDRLSEERKKVCDYLRKELNIRPNHPYISIDLVSQENFFQNLLDQVEKGESNVKD